MITAAYVQHLSRYNRWANRLLYEAAETVGDEAYRRDRSAFFGSLHNTLNHLLVTDRIWLARFTGQPNPETPLTVILHEDRADLRQARAEEDARIIAVMRGVDDAFLQGTLSYANMAGEAKATPAALAIGHFFNHQTHHRGQCHCMLSQAGLKPPQLDLLYFPDTDEA